jgi:4-carboxymuconolactone decarboxylase
MISAPSMTSVPRFPETDLPERLGPPATLDAAQHEAADELTNGPRRGVCGPFRPLLYRPPLLRALGKLGESLRHEGTPDPALREWAIRVVARELSNVFEWDMHLPLAALDAGQLSPHRLRADLALARAVTSGVIGQHRPGDETHLDVLKQWGEPTLVELLTLVGYFATVCWLVNVAHTPGPAACVEAAACGQPFDAPRQLWIHPPARPFERSLRDVVANQITKLIGGTQVCPVRSEAGLRSWPQRRTGACIRRTTSCTRPPPRASWVPFSDRARPEA